MPGLGAFINVMIGIAVVIGFLVIFLSMYTTIIERTREIGVLKSLGASKPYIVQIILSETTLLCVAGVVGGNRAEFPDALDFHETVSDADDSDYGQCWIARDRAGGCLVRRIRVVRAGITRGRAAYE